MPDLRGEFLRGTGVNSHANQGSGSNVGEHQDGTEHIYFGINTSTDELWTDTSSPRPGETQIGISKTDSMLGLTTQLNNKGHRVALSTWEGATNRSHFTSRPTNTSVLYCIKYEPTYFMKNSYINNTVGFTKTLLFEGSAGETGVTYDLNDSIKNYDLILIKAGFNAESNPHYKTMLIDTDDIDSSKTQNEFLFTRTLLNDTTRLIGFNFSQGYDKLTIWTVKASDSTENIAITKIIGIKSATDNNVYTDDEISAAISEVLG